MKNTLAAVCIAFISLYSSNLFAVNPNEWTTYFDNDTVKIEYTYQNCDFSSTAKQEVIVFKFTNLISQNILLSYKADIWHNDICTNCEQESEESVRRDLWRGEFRLRVRLEEEIRRRRRRQRHCHRP